MVDNTAASNSTVIAQSSLKNAGLVRGNGKKEFGKRAGSGNADGTNKIGSEDHISDSIALIKAGAVLESCSPYCFILLLICDSHLFAHFPL
jgi:hypothetical protein